MKVWQNIGKEKLIRIEAFFLHEIVFFFALFFLRKFTVKIMEKIKYNLKFSIC